jgi:ribosomal-protein-alanine N-acetyltransferase
MPFKVVDGRCHAFRDEDFWMLAEIETHPEVMRWNIDVYTDNKAEMYRSFKEAVERLQVERDKIFLVGKLNGKVIGFVGVRGRSGEANVGDVGLSVHPNYWNRGFGTRLLRAVIEKARAEGFLKLELETLASNRAMLKIAEKAGFKIESVKKIWLKRDRERGEDVILMEMTF